MSELHRLIDEYQPSQEVLDVLGEVHFVALIGPSAIGKNAVAQAVERIDVRTNKVISHTTRQARDGEIDGRDYHFEIPNEEFLRSFEEDLSTGSLVQAAYHPTTGDYYYSTKDNYVPEHRAIMDTLPIAVENMRKLNFGWQSEIMLVSNFGEWRPRFEEKSTEMTEEKRRKRVSEAITNLQWGLSQPQVKFVINEQDKVEHAAYDVVSIMNGDDYESIHGLNIGHTLLRDMMIFAE